MRHLACAVLAGTLILPAMGPAAAQSRNAQFWYYGKTFIKGPRNNRFVIDFGTDGRFNSTWGGGTWRAESPSRACLAWDNPSLRPRCDDYRPPRGMRGDDDE